MTNFSNIAVDTTLNGAIDASVTSLVVNSATGYPVVPFNIQINDEVIRVEAKSGTTFSSLDRGYDGTTGASHIDGDDVKHVVIAEDMDSAIHDNVAAEISAITSKATPIDADFLLIEDSAAGDAKKKIMIGDLPGGDGGAGITFGKDSVATSETTSTTTYTDLATSGPAVTITTGTEVLVIINARFRHTNTARGGAISVEVSGATTIAAADTNGAMAMAHSTGATKKTLLWVGVLTLNAGSNIFTMKYREYGGAGTVTFDNRTITIVEWG